VEVAREQQLLLERRAERRQPEELEGQPQSRPAERSAELDREIRCREDATKLSPVAEIGRAVTVSLGELTLVTHDERTGPERQEETLVRVHDDAPRALDSGEDAPAVLGEDEEAAVRCVDLEP
jgi:hypothetical protein